MASTRDIPAKGYCCSSWRALCFWGCAFAVFYAAGLATIHWLHLGGYQPSALFAALGLACVANVVRNRTFHCVITGPFFLVVALALGLASAGAWKIHTAPLGATVVIVGCAALLHAG